MKISSFYEVLYSDINITDIVCLHQYWTSSNNSFSYITSPRANNGICLISDGKATYSANGKNIAEAVSGDIIYLPKNSHYFARFTQIPSKCMLINFLLYDSNGNEVKIFDNVSKIMSGANGGVVDLFAEICDIYLKSSNKILLKSKLFELTNFIAEQNMLREQASAVIPAIDYINNNLNSVLKIPQLAKLCAMSESSFRREFIRFTGENPKQYIADKKMKKAKQMILNSELTINEISMALGFYDNAYFSKCFKAAMGKSPSEYKRC